jgi:mannitol-specific phosphotransferase system IIBC component
MENNQLLAQTMAFLVGTNPETNLGKLLGFCLATKVESKNSGKTPLSRYG